MNVIWTKTILLAMLFLFQPAFAVNELDIPLATNLTSLTIEDIKQQPRYNILIQNNMCLGKYTSEDKAIYPILNSKFIWFFGHPYYQDKAEMYLIRGLHVSSDEVINVGLIEYPEFKKHFEIFRTKCFKTREKVDVALFNLWKAEKLGSLLATDILKIYRQRIGDDKYFRYIQLFEKQSQIN